MRMLGFLALGSARNPFVLLGAVWADTIPWTRHPPRLPGGSSNGRTPAFGAGYQGSNPCPPARIGGRSRGTSPHSMETDKKSQRDPNRDPEHSVPIDLTHIEPLALLGEKDATLRRLETAFQVRGVLRNGVLTLNGPSPRLEQAADVVRELVNRVSRGQMVDAQDVEYLAQLRLEEGSDAVINGGPL